MSVRKHVHAQLTCNNPFLPDADHDGVVDVMDNCSEIANATQTDVDRDSIGDVCDNCPLVANTDQGTIGDSDGLGDNCDPHPTVGGDCLILLDTFAEPARFAEYWQVGAVGALPQVEHEIGGVVLTPAAGSPAGFVALAAGVPIAQITDIEMRATVTLTSAQVGVFASGDGLASGYLCGIDGASVRVEATSPTGGANSSSQLITAPIGNQLLLMLHVGPTTTPLLSCVGNYGLALGLVTVTAPQQLVGSAGMFSERDGLHVNAIALMRVAPSGCPPPIFR